MNILEEKIVNEGRVYAGNVLKVDSFLNHQLDVELLDELANNFYEKYKNKGITKILTIEASGIAVACSCARLFKIPVLFAKKAKSLNIGNEVYVSRVSSYTYGTDYDITISTRYLGREDKVLIVDDFLALGNATKGLVDLCNQAGAKIEGICICIEKGFQAGGDDLRKMGYEVTSLAIIDDMADDGTITFRKQ